MIYRKQNTCRSIAVAAGLLCLYACSDCAGPGSGTTPTDAAAGPAAATTAGTTGDAPDTSQMGAIVLEKINADPAVDGRATLQDFRQKSITTEKLGDGVSSAVVEFEGSVVFSADVEWGWKGPSKAGEPAKFEARAEYVNQGDGWQLFGPLGIYPL